MKSTPAFDGYNVDLLAMIPPGARRIVDVGCSKGQLAAAYRAANPGSEVFGIEIDPDYAAAARQHCAKVLCSDIETLPDPEFTGLFPADCWVFGDSLEHLRDPWALLRRIRPHLAPTARIAACIPNAQHWSVQARLNSGLFRYEDSGLLDRTHLRWFTRTTTIELFQSSGYRIAKGRPRILNEKDREQVLTGIRAMAKAIGADADMAAHDATVFQWVVLAEPV